MPRKSAKTAQLETENAALRAQVERMQTANTPADIGAPLIREAEKPRRSGSVSVACKIPQGMKLQLQHKQATKIPSGRGGEYITDDQWVFGGKAHHVFGPSMPAMGGVPDGFIMPHKLEGGYALTRGIPADFWEQWLEQNKLADYVTSGMIFAMDESSVIAKSREREELKSGLEPISREIDSKGQLKDRRIPKPISGSVARIGFDAERTPTATADAV